MKYYCITEHNKTDSVAVSLTFLRNMQNEFEKAAKSYPYPHEVTSERDLINIAKCKLTMQE